MGIYIASIYSASFSCFWCLVFGLWQCATAKSFALIFMLSVSKDVVLCKIWWRVLKTKLDNLILHWPHFSMCCMQLTVGYGRTLWVYSVELSIRDTPLLQDQNLLLTTTWTCQLKTTRLCSRVNMMLAKLTMRVSFGSCYYVSNMYTTALKCALSGCLKRI